MAYLRSQLVPSEQTPKLNVARDAAAFLALASWPFASVFFFFWHLFSMATRPAPLKLRCSKMLVGPGRAQGGRVVNNM